MSNKNNAWLLKELQEQFASDITSVEEPYGLLTIELDRSKILPLLQYVYNHDELQMRFLTDVCGMHFPDKKGSELAAVYHVHSFINNLRLRIKCYMPIDDPRISTVTSLFGSANWQERETYDFFGIIFEGHPNLKRILNIEEMDYFPMRKEYPLEDQTRTDKDDKYFGR